MIPLSSRSVIEIEDEYLQLRSSPQMGADETRIALLSSFTTIGLEASLAVGLRSLGMAPRVFLAGYNQYAQELFETESELWKYRPDLAILLLDGMSLLGERYKRFAIADHNQKEGWIEDVSNTVVELAAAAEVSQKTTLVLSNIIFHPYSPYGIVDWSREDGIAHFAHDLDRRIVSGVNQLQNVVMFDVKGAIAAVGWEKVFDPRLYYLGHILLRPEFMPFLAQRLLSFVLAKKGQQKKCIVVDLDNTLWGGILGEDTVDGIVLGDVPPGNVFTRIQEILLDYNRRGILLAVCSKNNECDVIEAFEKRPEMVLSRDNFAAWKVNWKDKAQNLEEIAKDLNIARESMVFIDNSPLERDWVRQRLPEVEVPELPEDVALWPGLLTELPWFESLTLTQEDVNRSKIYVQERKRRERSRKFTDLDGFLSDLNIEVQVTVVNDQTLRRASQLTLRTNQFNLCTKRFSDRDLGTHLKATTSDCVTLRVRDRYGDYGVVGLLLGDLASDGWYMVDNL